MTQPMMLPIDQCEVRQSSITYNAYDIYLDEEIKSPDYYRQAFQVLRSAQEGDLIRIYISSVGGNMNSAIMFRSAILECRAEVVAIIEAEAYSAASLIALSCPTIEVKPYATMMCHAASFSSGGAVQSIRDHVEFTGRHAEEFMEEVYQDFLNPEELEDLRKGREIWLDYKEVGDRLDYMFEMRALLQEESFGENQQLEQGKSLDEIVEEAVELALQKLKKDYDIVPKPPKPKAPAKKPVVKKEEIPEAV